MALIPTIPTSFVPHMASAESRHEQSDFGSVFSFLAYGILGIVFAAAIAVFFYDRILAAELSAKNAELAKAEGAIDPATIESFVQLRDRLDSSQKLLSGHVAFSGLFSAFGSILPATVRFTSLQAQIDPEGVASVDGSGVSKSFNALSVASAAFAADGRFKDVIFSKMTINKDSSVSFVFSATLDPKILAFSPSAASSTTPAVEPASAATTSAATKSATSTTP